MNTIALSDTGPLTLLAWSFDWSAFALYALAVLGVVYIIGFSQITIAARTRLSKLGAVGLWVLDLLQCPKCLGYHLGYLVALAGVGPFASMRFGWLLAAPITAAVMLIADRLDLFDHAIRRNVSDATAEAEFQRTRSKLDTDAQLQSMIAAQQKLLNDLRTGNDARAVVTAFPPRHPGDPV